MNDRAAVMGGVFVVQAVCFLCFFIYSAVPDIISRNTEGSYLKVERQAEKFKVEDLFCFCSEELRSWSLWHFKGTGDDNIYCFIK